MKLVSATSDAPKTRLGHREGDKEYAENSRDLVRSQCELNAYQNVQIAVYLIVDLYPNVTAPSIKLIYLFLVDRLTLSS